MRRLVFSLTTLLALACGGGVASPSAPLEGKWIVENEAGQETGQTVTITADHITMTNGALSPSDGAATFATDGDHITAEWYGSQVDFTLNGDGTVRMEKAGMAVWNLKRE